MRVNFIVRRFMACMLTALAATGCQSARTTQVAGNTAQSTPSPQSYGYFTAKVEKGVTTQADLMELFGGPNISTLDSDGTETWVYEKTSSSTEIATQTGTNKKLRELDLFFGLGLYGTGSDKTHTTSTTTVTRSIKTLTVIIKFDADKTVSEFSARAAYF